jgi:hypothetical protein
MLYGFRARLRFATAPRNDALTKVDTLAPVSWLKQDYAPALRQSLKIAMSLVGSGPGNV